MTHYSPGDMVQRGYSRGEVIIAAPVGYRDQWCAVQFAKCELWVHSSELRPIVERLPFVPRVVGGSDHDIDTMPSEVAL